MARPTKRVDWATELNYTGGPLVGAPTKLTVPPLARQEGARPKDRISAQVFNEVLNAHGQWLDYLKNIDTFHLVVNECTYPSDACTTVFGIVRVPASYEVYAMLGWDIGGDLNVYTSLDGVRWPLQAGVLVLNPDSDLSLDHIVYSALTNSVYLLGDSASANAILKSSSTTGLNPRNDPTGTTWAAVTDPAAAADRNRFAESPAIMVIARGAGGFITSTNGTAWTERTHTCPSKEIKALAYAPVANIFAALTTGGGILKSVDGIAWTYHGDVPAQSFFDMIYSEAYGGFIAAGLGFSYVSTDGINWYQGGATFTSSPNVPQKLTYRDGQLILEAPMNVASQPLISNDHGTTWQQMGTIMPKAPPMITHNGQILKALDMEYFNVNLRSVQFMRGIRTK